MRRGEPRMKACMDINKWSMRTLVPGDYNDRGGILFSERMCQIHLVLVRFLQSAIG